MIIDCISDLHGFYPELHGGDLLIVAGDLTARDRVTEYDRLFMWLSEQNYKKIIWIAGNHDGCVEKKEISLHFAINDKRFQYLQDFCCEFEGLKIWGSPWTPTFYDWHFMKDRGAPIKEMWDLIPRDIDILVTHGPPYGILDKVNISSKGDKDKFAGCEELRNKVLDGTYFTKLKLHIFGHIHEQGGKTFETTLTKFVNASIVNENYEHVNKPVRVIL